MSFSSSVKPLEPRSERVGEGKVDLGSQRRIASFLCQTKGVPQAPLGAGVIREGALQPGSLELQLGGNGWDLQVLDDWLEAIQAQPRFVEPTRASPGQGIGELLTNAAMDRARGAGAKAVGLTSRPSREAANRLYLRMGFEVRETNVYRLKL